MEVLLRQEINLIQKSIELDCFVHVLQISLQVA